MEENKFEEVSEQNIQQIAKKFNLNFQPILSELQKLRIENMIFRKEQARLLKNLPLSDHEQQKESNRIFEQPKMMQTSLSNLGANDLREELFRRNKEIELLTSQLQQSRKDNLIAEQSLEMYKQRLASSLQNKSLKQNFKQDFGSENFSGSDPAYFVQIGSSQNNGEINEIQESLQIQELKKTIHRLKEAFHDTTMTKAKKEQNVDKYIEMIKKLTNENQALSLQISMLNDQIAQSEKELWHSNQISMAYDQLKDKFQKETSDYQKIINKIQVFSRELAIKPESDFQKKEDKTGQMRAMTPVEIQIWLVQQFDQILRRD